MILNEIKEAIGVRNQTIEGDALTVLKTLPDKIVQSCVTSPPYWGLRSYKTEPQIWGGKENCDHEWVTETRTRDNRYTAGLAKDFDTKTGAGGKFEAKQKISTNFCRLCNAWRGELGLEPTPDCSRPFMELRDNLSDKEREYVMNELKRLGLI